MIVVVCPGQGSQAPGFLEPWLTDDSARELVARISETTKIDLIRHGTVSDAETIRDTAIAQPLIVVAGILTLRALRETADASRIGGIAGHSVGEITAAAGAGILSDDEAVRFVSIRAQAMAQAARASSTGMSAVVGGDPDAVVEHVTGFGLAPANYNGGGQIVVAGELDALARLAEAPLRGTRVIPLQVAGAFHTETMRGAHDTLAAAADQFHPHAPTLPIWTNHDGTKVEDGTRFVDLMVNQVASPVRWDKCMESFAEASVTGLIELAPAGALTGLARRGLKGVPTVAIKSPDDLAAASELLSTDAS